VLTALARGLGLELDIVLSVLIIERRQTTLFDSSDLARARAAATLEKMSQSEYGTNNSQSRQISQGDETILSTDPEHLREERRIARRYRAEEHSAAANRTRNIRRTVPASDRFAHADWDPAFVSRLG
jgi:hypothetical protein